MEQSDAPSSAVDASAYTYVVGIDIGSQTCSRCVLKPNTSQVIKPTDFANAAAGFALLHDKLEQLGVPPEQLLIGLEATSPDAREPLPLFAESRLPSVEARIPGKHISLREPSGLRAKTDKLDATTIARVLLSGEARRGYVPAELIATYRELVRLHSQRSR